MSQRKIFPNQKSRAKKIGRQRKKLILKQKKLTNKKTGKAKKRLKLLLSQTQM